jgi:hypothetical protein
MIPRFDTIFVIKMKRMIFFNYNEKGGVRNSVDNDDDNNNRRQSHRPGPAVIRNI